MNANEKLDVLIVGAGVSGLGMAYNLQKERPNDSFAILESRENIGGTWDLFKYPGIRSDSDMYTFAYSFKPWREREFVGSAERIKNYLHELVEDEGLGKYIRFQQKVTDANWNSTVNRWIVTIQIADGSSHIIEAKFFLCCAGYYNYDKGYVPEFEGYEDYKGTIAHPQKWPEDLNYEGKKVVVIGSGATAVTVAPTMAEKAHVTMLQRSPTYIYSSPESDIIYRALSKILPAGLTNRIMRLKYIGLQMLFFILCKRYPNFVRKMLRKENMKALEGAADVDVHFNPTYKPWDQRVCMVPDNDLFTAIKDKRMDVVTDHIDRFTEKGILLKSGKELEADIIVPATGLDLQLWGMVNLKVDGQPVDSSKLTNYKGMMFSQLPNFVWVFGYTNASWTLKAELTYDYVCRLLKLMEERQHDTVFPYLDPADQIEPRKMVDLQSGYLIRKYDIMPQQGPEFPWCNKDLYIKDLLAIKHSTLDDGVLKFDDTSVLGAFYRTEDTTEQTEKSAA